MKKVIAFLVALLLAAAPVAALAEVDISGLSFDELLALKEQINLALWASEAWQEVTVPAGVYEIGKDIPAGYWTITPPDKAWTSIAWGPKLDETKTNIDYMTEYAYETIVSPSSRAYGPSDTASVSWELTEGTYIVVKQGSVIFTPYAGANLGFK